MKCIALAKPSSVGLGTWVSPSCMWLTREWCTACERCQEKYGVRQNECTANPTASCNTLLSEKAPCPHSCPTTQKPKATVPLAAAYASQTGANASVSGTNWLARNPSPKSIQVENTRYNRDLGVLLSRQCFGMTAMTSPLVG